MTRKKLPTIKSLDEKLWKLFSEFIRLRDADWKGDCTCCTCGKITPWSAKGGAQAGHYISRTKKKTKFDERNVHAQCPQCNLYKKGAPQEYAIFIIEKYGQEVLEELTIAKHTIHKLNRSYYDEQIEYYKEEVKRLKLEKGL